METTYICVKHHVIYLLFTSTITYLIGSIATLVFSCDQDVIRCEITIQYGDIENDIVVSKDFSFQISFQLPTLPYEYIAPLF